MTLSELNHLPPDARAEELRKCCGASAWVEQLNQEFPVADEPALLAAATRIWQQLSAADWQEAFAHHPRIGGDVAALRAKFASTSTWAEGEQAAVREASTATLEALAAGNEVYARKFGYIFIVCATGKSADEMLALLQARLPNPPAEELLVAADEQRKITEIRLKKLLTT